MARYKNTSRRKGNKSLSTTIYHGVPEEDTDMYFIAQEGDICDNLANRFYGNPNLWWFIAKVNNLTTMNIPVGTSLRIPISTEKARGS